MRTSAGGMLSGTRSAVHSHTFPTMLNRPNALGGNASTGQLPA